MKNILRCLFIVAIILLSCEVKSVPAYPHPVKAVQPDGSVLTVLIKGDEKVHWRESVDGYTLMFDKNDYLTYAVRDTNGNLQASDVIATDVEKRDVKTNSLLSKIGKGLYYSSAQVSTLMQVWQMTEESKAKAALKTSEALVGSFKTFCALVQFPEKMMVKTAADFEALMNQVGYHQDGRSGSVKDFFLESSYGQFNLSITIAGPYTAPKSESYYAGPPGDGTKNADELARWLAQAADADIDYSEYDSNDDGWVDGFHFLFAGYGQEASGGYNYNIWSHSWSFQTLTLDGKKLDTYSCSPELKGDSGQIMTDMGVIAHELSHAFGAPDYYDANYSSGGQYDGTGQWDIMANGSWNNDGDCPAHHNMYQKIQYGWVTPTVLSTGMTIKDMPSAEDSPIAYRVNTTTDGEYFIIENKQQVKFDKYIPGHGLIIYRVHKDIAAASSNNTVNNTYPQKMYPVCASSSVALPGNTSSSYGYINSQGCPFPGSSNKTSFTDSTKPSMKSWANANTDKPITDIIEANQLISFKFMGGSQLYPIIINSTINGKIIVMNGTKEVTSGTSIEGGTTLTISTEPAEGYRLKEVKVNDVVINSNTIVVSGTTTISADFEALPPQHIISILPAENGVIRVSNGTVEIISGTSVEEGTTLTILTEPAEGYELKEIMVNDAIITTNTTVVIGATTISASFEALPIKYTVRILLTENGIVKVKDDSDAYITTGTEVVEGSNLEIIATANDGYELDAIIVNGSRITENNIVIRETTVIGAEFKLIPPTTFIITASAGENGTITPSGVITVNQGEQQTFTMQANDGYQIRSLLVDAVEMATAATYTFENVSNNHAIDVSFEPRLSIDDALNSIIDIYAYDKTLYISNITHQEAVIEIINISGKVIITSRLTSDRHTMEIPNSGVYMVRIIQNNIVQTKKIIIK